MSHGNLFDRGIGIPVAWTILLAGRKHAWLRAWLRMLRLLRPAIPQDWTVIVLVDRGLYARWPFRRIVRLGWHPFLLINRGAKFRAAGQAQWHWLSDLLPDDGGPCATVGTCFKDSASRLPCTLLAWWDAAYTDPWLVLTDLVLLLGLSIGIAFLLHWLLPSVGLEIALLVAMIAVGQAMLIFGRMMRTLPASPDPEGELDPSIVILDRELALPRRRQKRL